MTLLTTATVHPVWSRKDFDRNIGCFAGTRCLLCLLCLLESSLVDADATLFLQNEGIFLESDRSSLVVINSE